MVISEILDIVQLVVLSVRRSHIASLREKQRPMYLNRMSLVQRMLGYSIKMKLYSWCGGEFWMVKEIGSADHKILEGRGRTGARVYHRTLRSKDGTHHLD